MAAKRQPRARRADTTAKDTATELSGTGLGTAAYWTKELSVPPRDSDYLKEMRDFRGPDWEIAQWGPKIKLRMLLCLLKGEEGRRERALLSSSCPGQSRRHSQLTVHQRQKKPDT
ncbi:hypothetical protein DPEC_G00197290 [Dallia pectoralis]|uniref:Uncharacterized protein n=1 Tax=Dallia pectoralis TaxID=75939 RepID=A0ACC2G7X1_DALPE|nr:hypothetical protein DPEC_G00197290 [Dallia pectoralis]